MRWFWIDRFVEFQRGKVAAAVKNVTLSDPPMDEYLPGRPYFAHSLIIEGMAQTGGILVAELGGFQKRVVLAKVGKAVFHRTALPGDQMVYRAEIQDLQEEGAIVSGTSHIQGELQAEIELTFAFLGNRFGDKPLFPPSDLARLLRVLRLYEVAVDEDGNLIEMPPDLRLAEEHFVPG